MTKDINSALKEQTERFFVWQLTDDQRRQIYKEEKSRIEQTSPILSTEAKVFVAVYFLGCLLLYLGIGQAFIEFIETRQWRYQPESDIWETLFNAVIELIRPFLAVLFTFWIVCVPVGFILGVWCFCVNFIKNLKRLVNKGKN